MFVSSFVLFFFFVVVVMFVSSFFPFSFLLKISSSSFGFSSVFLSHSYRNFLSMAMKSIFIFILIGLNTSSPFIWAIFIPPFPAVALSYGRIFGGPLHVPPRARYSPLLYSFWRRGWNGTLWPRGIVKIWREYCKDSICRPPRILSRKRWDWTWVMSRCQWCASLPPHRVFDIHGVRTQRLNKSCHHKVTNHQRNLIFFLDAEKYSGGRSAVLATISAENRVRQKGWSRASSGLERGMATEGEWWRHRDASVVFPGKIVADSLLTDLYFLVFLIFFPPSVLWWVWLHHFNQLISRQDPSSTPSTYQDFVSLELASPPNIFFQTILPTELPSWILQELADERPIILFAQRRGSSRLISNEKELMKGLRRTCPYCRLISVDLGTLPFRTQVQLGQWREEETEITTQDSKLSVSVFVSQLGLPPYSLECTAPRSPTSCSFDRCRILISLMASLSSSQTPTNRWVQERCKEK